ncbi:hypothetical protein [Blastococcus sp. SYSU D00820]
MIGRPPHPFDLRFAELTRHRPVALLSPLVEVDREGPLPEGAGPLPLAPGPRAPFAAVVVDVVRADDGGGVDCGLAGPAGAVLARHRDGRVRLEVAAGAGGPVVVAEGDAGTGTGAPFRLACVVNENRVVALVAPAGTEEWRPVAWERERVAAVLDLRDPAVLAGLSYAAGVTGPAETGRVRAGYSGAVGLRDPQLVRHPDGRPVVRDGKAYLTLTNAGLGFFQQAHWGVWTLDLADPGRLEQVGALFSERDGLVLGDHAGCVVWDEERARYTVMVSSWGDHDPERGTHVRVAVGDERELLAGVHVLRTERLELPTEVSAWDPSLARVGDRWLLAFTECPSFGPPRYVFHPALAETRDADPTRGLRLVGADAALEQTEGTLLQRFGDDWYLLASDRDAAEYPVYDTAMRRVRSLVAPYGTNIPHPLLVRPGPDRPEAWWMVTFDGTAWHEEALGYGTHGDLLVLGGTPPAPRERLEALARGAARRLPPGVRAGLRSLAGRRGAPPS